MKRSPAISINNYNKKSCLPPQQQLVHRLKPRKQKQFRGANVHCNVSEKSIEQLL